jgi:hypothetical protein
MSSQQQVYDFFANHGLDGVPFEGGHDPDLFHNFDVLRGKYICGVCHHVARIDGMKQCAADRHCYCGKCEATYRATERNAIHVECMLCRETGNRPITSAESSTVYVLKELIQMDCPTTTLLPQPSNNGPDKCNWQGTLSQLGQHVREVCPNVLVVCPDCGANMYRLHLLDHRAECPNRKVQCTYEGCQWRGRPHLLDAHLSVCDRVSVQCPYCNETMPLATKQQHINIFHSATCELCGVRYINVLTNAQAEHRKRCSLTDVPCPYFRVGCSPNCTGRLRRAELPRHTLEVSNVRHCLVGLIARLPADPVAFEENMVRYNNLEGACTMQSIAESLKLLAAVVPKLFPVPRSGQHEAKDQA